MDKCLEYFKAVISDPKRAEPWLEWGERNAETVRSHFPREDYLRLKFRKLEAARQILFDRGMLDENELDYCSPNFGDTHCHFCGQELFWAIPGETTPDQIVAVPEIPYNLTGKKLEVPVKRLLLGSPRAEVVSDGAVRNPAALDVFEQMSDRQAPTGR